MANERGGSNFSAQDEIIQGLTNGFPDVANGPSKGGEQLVSDCTLRFLVSLVDFAPKN